MTELAGFDHEDTFVEEDEKSEIVNANPTLDFFLSANPDEETTEQFEVKRLGVRFTVRNINDEELERCLKRSESRQTKQDKARGIQPERDRVKMEVLVITEATKHIEHRLLSAEEAKATGQDEFGPILDIRDERLLTRWGPRPEDFIKKWLNSGERTQLADLITDLAGFESGAVVNAGN